MKRSLIAAGVAALLLAAGSAQAQTPAPAPVAAPAPAPVVAPAAMPAQTPAARPATTPAAAPAAMPPLNFDQAAYITCREANAMNSQARRALAEFLGEHSARYRGVLIPEGGEGQQLGHLVRGGCTLSPDAYLFTVIDRAVLAEMPRLPKRQ